MTGVQTCALPISRGFWFLAAALALTGLGTVAIIVHQIPFLTESAGFSVQQASLVAMSMSFTSLVGRLGFGWLADYVDKRRVLAIAYLMLGLGILLLAQVSSLWQVVLFLAVFSPDRKSTRLNSSHIPLSRMPSSA